MKTILSIATLLVLSVSNAQDTLDATSTSNRGVYSISYLTGKVLVHSEEVGGIKNAEPKGLSIDISKLAVDSASYSYTRSFIRQGVSFTFYDFGTPVLGKGYILSYFIEPHYRIGTKFQFQFRADFGAGYFDSPFDSIKNPANKNYSLRVTPFVHVSANVGYHISKNFTLAAGAHFNHISNGSYKLPNFGLNWSAFSATLYYHPQTNRFPKYNKPPRYTWDSDKVGVDIGIMFVPRQDYYPRWLSTRKLMIGLFGHAYKKVSRISAISAGAELAFNKFEDAPGATENNSKPAMLASVLIGHEFLMGRFIFGQQFGRYLNGHPRFFTSTYHRWGLRYRLNRQFFLGFNLKVHKFTADFIDLRLQYKLR